MLELGEKTMKKVPLSLGVVFILVSCMMFVMSCDDTPGLGDVPQNTPENVFDGSEWEQKSYKIENVYDEETGGYIQVTTDELRYYKKISFTGTSFTFYDKANSQPHFWENTYTGTYSLFYDEDGRKRIQFISDESSLNGVLGYIHPIYVGEQSSPDNTVMFTVGVNDFPVGGIFIKVLP